MHTLSITLLGPFEARLDGAPLGGFTYNKVRALLAYLAVEADRPHTRAHLAALLWPDVLERLARQNLSQALTMLRTILGERSLASHNDDDTPFLLITSDTIQLNPLADCTVDVTRFATLLAQVEAHQHRGVHLCIGCIERLRQAVALYGGDLLAQLPTLDSDIFEEWAQALREQRRQQAIGAFERLTRAAEWHEQYGEAIEYTQRQLDLAPRFESSERELLRLISLAGQPSQQPMYYKELGASVMREWDARPQLTPSVPRDQISSPAPAAYATLLLAPKSSALHVASTALLDRTRELDEVCARLREATGRFLTIIGASGIGKTGLALAAAHELRFEFAHGVCVVDLAALTDSTQLLPAIAHALALPVHSGLMLIDSLASSLRERHLLLVLDGCEHVLDAAPAIAALLAACPALSILATSRTPLRVRAERRYYLGAMSEERGAMSEE